MTKYIKNNILNLGNTLGIIEHNMEKLLQYIYKQFPLNYDEMEKLYQDIQVPVDFDDLDDEDRELNNYYRYNLKFVNYMKEDDKYIYDFQDDNFCQEDYDNDPFIIELHGFLSNKFLSNNSSSQLSIKKFKNMEFFNNCNGNKDARGVRYLDWRLHFWKKFIISRESGLTLDDIIVAAYKIKRHKFENNYELYCGVDELYCGVDEMGIFSSTLSINVCFEHTS